MAVKRISLHLIGSHPSADHSTPSRFFLLRAAGTVSRGSPFYSRPTGFPSRPSALHS